MDAVVLQCIRDGRSSDQKGRPLVYHEKRRTLEARHPNQSGALALASLHFAQNQGLCQGEANRRVTVTCFSVSMLGFK